MKIHKFKPTLFIKDGQIMDTDGEHIFPEIGNSDHIDLLKKYDLARENGIDDYEVEATVKVKIRFTCLCGYAISCEKSDIDMDMDNNGYVDDPDYSYQIAGASCTCHICNQRYKLMGKKDGSLVIKMMEP